MEAQSEEAQVLLQLQHGFVAQMQADLTRMRVEQEPFEDLDLQYKEAAQIYAESCLNKTITPEEEIIFKELFDHYTERKRQRKPKQIESVATLSSSKRRERSSSPLFEPQNESDVDEEYDSVNALTGSKRKRCKTPKRPPKTQELRKLLKDVKTKALNLLVAEAPAGKKQEAVRDSPVMLHALNQFRPGSVNYIGNGEWQVEGIKTPIKTHQLIHAGWMIEQEAKVGGPTGGILGDKMGLGKTLCALMNMIRAKALLGPEEPKTNLVVVTKTLKDQWMKEVDKHVAESTTDDIPRFGHVHCFNSGTGHDNEMRQFRDADIVLVTYTELANAFKKVRYPNELLKASEAEKEKHFEEEMRPKLSALFQFKFRAIYLDEGHTIRNGTTIAAMACQKLLSNHNWVLTGTPMTNDPADLYSPFIFVRHPDIVNLTFKEFKTNCKVKGNDGKDKVNIEWLSPILFEAMRFWVYEDTLFGRQLVEWPDSMAFELCKEFSAPERIIYSVVRRRIRHIAMESSKDSKTTGSYKFVKGLFMVLRQMTGHVLSIRTDIYRHLTQGDIDTIGDRIRKANELNPDPHANDYILAVRELHKSITCVVCKQRANNLQWAECNHAYCSDCLKKHRQSAKERGVSIALCEVCSDPLKQLTSEDVRPKWLNQRGKVIPSTKSAEVVHQLTAWRDPVSGNPKAKAVIFVSFKDSHRLLKATFAEEQWKCTILTSEMSAPERDQNLKQFSNDPGTFIMLATSGVAGTGLNLMAAQYLINYDHYFNDSTEQQANARIARIGQTAHATIVSLTVKGTVDEHIKKLKRIKTKNIRKVTKASKKEYMDAMLETFKEAKNNGELMGFDWDDELKSEVEGVLSNNR
ncbi:P-loop containing nucleoside triphosphate hydrolase protein, partial [Aureobasidium melanogenum]